MPSSSSSSSSSSASSSSASSSVPKAKAAPAAARASVARASVARAGTQPPGPAGGRRSTAAPRSDDYYSYYSYSDYSRSPTPRRQPARERRSIGGGDAPRRSTLRVDDGLRKSITRPEGRRDSMDSQHDLDAMQREIDRLRSQHTSGKLTAPPAWAAAPPGYEMFYGSPYAHPGTEFYPPPLDPWQNAMMAPPMDPWDYYHMPPPQPMRAPFPHHAGPFSPYMAPRQREYSPMGAPYGYPPSFAAPGGYRYPSPFGRSMSPMAYRHPPYPPSQPAPYYPPHMYSGYGPAYRSRGPPVGSSLMERNLAQEDKFMRAVLLIQRFVRRWRARRRFRKIIAEAKRVGAKAKARPGKPVQTAAMSIQRWWRRKQEEEQENFYAPQYQPCHVANGGRLGQVPSWQSENMEGHAAGSGKLAQLEAAQLLEQRMGQVMEDEARMRGGGAGPPGGFKHIRQPTRDVPQRRTAQEVASMLGLQREGPIPYQYRAAPPSRTGRDRAPCAPSSEQLLRMVPGTPSTKASATDSDKIAMKLQALGEKFRTEAVQRMRHGQRAL